MSIARLQLKVVVSTDDDVTPDMVRDLVERILQVAEAHLAEEQGMDLKVHDVSLWV